MHASQVGENFVILAPCQTMPVTPVGWQAASAVRLALLSLLLIYGSMPIIALAQTVEQEACAKDKSECVPTVFGSSQNTPELHYPKLPPTGDGKSIPTLPTGHDPVGEKADLRLERRNNMREAQAEATYKLAVEFLLHAGIAVDGRESYPELELKIAQEKEKQARDARERGLVSSKYASCKLPNSSAESQEGTTTCLTSFAPALCPSCRLNWRHRCERVGSGVDLAGVWRPVERCSDKELLSADFPGPQKEPNMSPVQSTILRGESIGQPSNCETFWEQLEGIGTDITPDNAEARIEAVCGGDMLACANRFQECVDEP